MPDALRLLVVDDDDLDRMALARALRGRGVEITEAATLAEGLSLLADPSAFDCAVVDYHLEKLGRYHANPLTSPRWASGRALLSLLTRAGG